MSIVIPPELETKLRAQAEAEGLTIEAYLERLLGADERAEEEITTLALEGINSGAAIEVDASYWQEKHRRLDERLKKKSF
jgi:uncharacterized protein YoaH (UPF0181 family)